MLTSKYQLLRDATKLHNGHIYTTKDVYNVYIYIYIHTVLLFIRILIYYIHYMYPCELILYIYTYIGVIYS